MLITTLRALGLAALSLALAASAATADVYEIDKDHSEVRFTWDHVGMSRQGGRFKDITGTLNFDPVNPGNSSVDVKIKVSSISTGVAKLDEHLIRSGEFFDAQAFPTISFRSTSVAPTVGRTAQVTGNLTMNGVTKPVTMDVRWNYSGAHPLGSINPAFKEVYVSGFSATATILRSDWGLSRTVPFISDELRITIESEFHRKQITSPQLPPEQTDTGPQPLPNTPPVGVPQQPQGLTVPAPGAPPPLPPSEGGPPHAAPQPPSPGAPPSPDAMPQQGPALPPLPDDSTEQDGVNNPATTNEPLEPLDGVGNQ